MSRTELTQYLKTQLAREPERKASTLAQKAKRGAIWFFITMLALTFISRFANEAPVPRVTLGSVSTGAIDQSVEGTGTWVAKDVTLVRVEHEGLRIDEVFVSPGQAVEAGDELFTYETASIEAVMAELTTEMERYRLQIKELKTGKSDSAKDAEFGIRSAKKALESANEKLSYAIDQIRVKKQKAYEDALFAYQTQCAQRDAALSSARRAVSAAEATLDPNDPSTQQALDQAKEALRSTEDNWDVQLAAPLRELKKAEDELRRVQAGIYDAVGELGPDIDAVHSAQNALEKAEFDYEQAKSNDRDANTKTGYQVDDVELSLSETQAQYGALAELLKQGGVVRAQDSGTVTEVGVAHGKKVTGEETVSLSAELAFRITLESEAAERLAQGDAVTLIEDGKKQGNKLSILSIGSVDAKGECEVMCEFAAKGKAGILGSSREFVIEKSADLKSLRVPIEALRQDGSGRTYVLTIGEEESVLGPQSIAVRVDVTLLLRDADFAAVSGSLQAGDKVIAGSEKRVEAGDRVMVSNG